MKILALIFLVVGFPVLTFGQERTITDRHGSDLGSLASHVRTALAAGDAPVQLTLDAGLQAEVERILGQVERGAAIVIDPATGDILAMVSVPGSGWPNRAITAYAPGAAFLPVTGLVGLSRGLADRKFTCTGGVSYGNSYLKCWIASRGSHGPLTLTEALAASCGPFFFQSGNDAGIDAFTALGSRLGLGKMTGVPLLGESAGILPDPAWLAKRYPRDTWRDGYTANVSIGQGFVLTTPLQLVGVTATIANGGTARPPRLLLTDPIAAGDDLLDDTLTTAAFERVRRGMWETVNGSGSGKLARIDGFEVAGRTGSAQNLLRRPDGQVVKDNHAWFLAFAPYEDPKFAVVVFVQGAKSGGQVAAPLAREILEAALPNR